MDSKTITVGNRKLTIELHHDTDCESPLENDTRVFITCRKGARSQYGNEPLTEEAHEMISRRIEAYGSDKAFKLAAALADEDQLEGEPLIGLPVYVYEHGQVAMGTSAFSCRWDSGQSGFVYVTRKTALEWMGGKRLTKAKVDRVLKSLTSVVEEYGRWCNGECYGYVIKEIFGGDEPDVELDSCWGFIGHEYAWSEAESAAKSYGEVRKAA